MKLSRPDLAALAVLGVVVVAIAACAIARVVIPDVLTSLGILLAGIAGGAAIPSTSSPAAVPEPLPPAPVPAPAYPPAAALLADPQTGTFPRIATHR